MHMPSEWSCWQIHCGLRDKFGSVVKNEAFIFQLEALFQTVFNGLGPDPEVGSRKLF